MMASAISTIDRRPTTRPCNLSRKVTQPASLRGALPFRGQIRFLARSRHRAARPRRQSPSFLGERARRWGAPQRADA